MEIDSAHADFGTDQFPPDDVRSRYRIVVAGRVRGDGSWTGNGLNIWVGEMLAADLNVDSRADIHMTGGADGIGVGINDEIIHHGGIRVRNFGTMPSSGLCGACLADPVSMGDLEIRDCA